MFKPSLEEFKELSKSGNLIPVYKEILADPSTSEPMRHHIEEELHELEVYEEHHHDEIVAGDHHDPNVLELFSSLQSGIPSESASEVQEAGTSFLPPNVPKVLCVQSLEEFVSVLVLSLAILLL